MKVKKYQASSMPEVMKIIRNDLGNDAVILNSREIQTRGFLGIFKKKKFEVIAALDTKLEQFEPIKALKQNHAGKPLVDLPVQNDKPINRINHVQNEDIRKDISELKNLVNNMMTQQSMESLPLPKPLLYLQDLFITQEINQTITKNVLAYVMEKWFTDGGKNSEDDVIKWAQAYLNNSIEHLPFGGITYAKKYINVVGPTGVGKTTTIAKIAASCLLNDNKKVAFITTDTYRIAAIEQLKTYANILNVPIEVCYNLADFQKATVLYEDYDLVFVDTAGRNFRDSKYVEELKDIIDFKKNMETYLVLSLTAKQKDMEEIYHQFSSLEIDKFIFTKKDETSSCGAMFNMITSCQKGVAYITNGQNVPDDILPANSENVISDILGARNV